MGKAEEGLDQIQLGMEIYRDLKSPPIFLPLLYGLQAGACAQAGKPEQGLTLLDEVPSLPSLGYGKVLQVDFFQLKGYLLLALSPDKKVEAQLWFLRALESAQEQGALMYELRAAISLFRLWRNTSQAKEAGRWLNEAYAKFTEGFTTPDLMEARELLIAEHLI